MLGEATRIGADAAEVELLAWDTAFWGVRIARVRGGAFDPARLRAIDRFCQSDRVACLFLLMDLEDLDLETTRQVETAGFQAVDVRVTLRAKTAAPRRSRSDASDRAIAIRPWQDADLPTLRRIAGSSHETTRFYADHHFPRDRCRGLYETWIARSCAGDADMVLVAADGSNAVGYVTCHRPKELGGTGQIGLLGVVAQARGQGVGTNLVAAALDWFDRKGVEDVTVVTQGRNLAALRLYERAGFMCDRRQLWYHKWYLPAPAAS